MNGVIGYLEDPQPFPFHQLTCGNATLVLQCNLRPTFGTRRFHQVAFASNDCRFNSKSYHCPGLYCHRCGYFPLLVGIHSVHFTLPSRFGQYLDRSSLRFVYMVVFRKCILALVSKIQISRAKVCKGCPIIRGTTKAKGGLFMDHWIVS